MDREDIYNTWLSCLESEFSYLAADQENDVEDVFEMLDAAVVFLKENHEDIL